MHRRHRGSVTKAIHEDRGRIDQGLQHVVPVVAEREPVQGRGGFTTETAHPMTTQALRAGMVPHDEATSCRISTDQGELMFTMWLPDKPVLDFVEGGEVLLTLVEGTGRQQDIEGEFRIPSFRKQGEQVLDLLPRAW